MDKQHGFSLIEVIVTMGIAAIVLSVGVPSFQSFIQNNRQTTSVNELATALRLARGTAVSLQVRIVVCKSNDGANCMTSGNWAQGWMVFADTNSNDTHDGGEDILRVHGAIHSNISFTGNTHVMDQVAFKPQGMLDGLNGTITYCDSRGPSHATALVINRGGQVRFEDNGNLLTC